MKTIKESIIGRRGMPLRSEVWIMFLMENDYRIAEAIFPSKYMVRMGTSYVYLFCIDDVQWLKRYFEYSNKHSNNKYQNSFSNPFSKLCVTKRHSHFKNLDHIKEWIQSAANIDDIYQSPYVDDIKDVQKYIETL